MAKSVSTPVSRRISLLRTQEGIIAPFSTQPLRPNSFLYHTGFAQREVRRQAPLRDKSWLLKTAVERAGPCWSPWLANCYRPTMTLSPLPLKPGSAPHSSLSKALCGRHLFGIDAMVETVVEKTFSCRPSTMTLQTFTSPKMTTPNACGCSHESSCWSLSLLLFLCPQYR
jgi:hypothetical protein